MIPCQQLIKFLNLDLQFLEGCFLPGEFSSGVVAVDFALLRAELRVDPLHAPAARMDGNFFTAESTGVCVHFDLLILMTILTSRVTF